MSSRKKDRIFFIRTCEKRQDQEGASSRIGACLHPEPIKLEYNGYLGSCQTFYMKIFDIQGFKKLNPEAFLASESTLKQVAGWFVSNHQKALELVCLMDERFANPSMQSLSLEGEYESLVTMCSDILFAEVGSTTSLNDRSARRQNTVTARSTSIKHHHFPSDTVQEGGGFVQSGI